MYRRIRDMREDADLLQKDVADYLQCTQVSYSHYELGKRDIPTDVLIKSSPCMTCSAIHATIPSNMPTASPSF